MMWDARFCRKLFNVEKILDGQFSFHRRERILGCQALSKAPAMSRVRRQHFWPAFLARWVKFMTASMASVVDLPAVNPYCCFGTAPVDSRKYVSLFVTSFSRHLPGIDSRLIPLYLLVWQSLLLSAFGIARIPAVFHTFGNWPRWRHLLKIVSQKVGEISWRRLTITLSIPSVPGHLSFRLDIVSSTSWCSKSGSTCVVGALSSEVRVLMSWCSALSSSGGSSGKNLFNRAIAVSLSDIVVVPLSNVRVGMGVLLAKPDLAILYIFHGVSLEFSVQKRFHDSCLALSSSDL